MASTAIPLLALAILELGLRIAGIGYPTSFFLPGKTGGTNTVSQNDQFGWRYFGPRMSRTPTRLFFNETKPSGAYRIFVLGESAAHGDPQPAFGISRILEVLLNDRFPDRRFEVINATMTAINSHAILPIARECARLDGDLWVIYMGNNEVVGPYGAGTVFGPRAPSLPFIRASLALRTTRTGQAIESIINRIRPNPISTNEWGGMMMFLDHQVRRDDPQMEAVYSHFHKNLEDVLSAAKEAGAEVVLSTVASNLKDCAPFASLHRTGLSGPQSQEWSRHYQSGVAAQSRKRFADAIELYTRAADIDAEFADLQFRWATCALALNREDEALDRFSRARDYDALRFRCDSRLNEIIREAAGRHAADGVSFVDGNSALAQQCLNGILGSELLYEHVHPNFDGNYLLAVEIAGHVEKSIAEESTSRMTPPPDWLSRDACASRLAWTELSEYEALTEIGRRINEPPFTAQLNHNQQEQRVEDRVSQLLPELQPASLRAIAETHRRAIAHHPNDWVLHENLADVFKRLEANSEAFEAWRRVGALLPRYSTPHVQMGLLLALDNRLAEAEEAFRRALRIEPNSDRALGGLASVLAQKGKQQDAIQLYKRALRLKPNLSQAHLGLGLLLKSQGKTDEANRHFTQAIQHPVAAVSSLKAVARVCYENGWMKEALTNFTKAAELDPADATLHLYKGQVLAALGNRDDARTSYEKALQTNPNLAEAHFRLGFELGRAGQDHAALSHFAEAVRLAPDLIEARVNLGIALVRAQKNHEAMEQFNKALQLDPSNETARKYVDALGRL